MKRTVALNLGTEIGYKELGSSGTGFPDCQDLDWDDSLRGSDHQPEFRGKHIRECNAMQWFSSYQTAFKNVGICYFVPAPGKIMATGGKKRGLQQSEHNQMSYPRATSG